MGSPFGFVATPIFRQSHGLLFLECRTIRHHTVMQSTIGMLKKTRLVDIFSSNEWPISLEMYLDDIGWCWILDVYWMNRSYHPIGWYGYIISVHIGCFFCGNDMEMIFPIFQLHVHIISSIIVDIGSLYKCIGCFFFVEYCTMGHPQLLHAPDWLDSMNRSRYGALIQSHVTSGNLTVCYWNWP